MTAKEAAAASEKVAEKIRLEQEQAAERERLRKEKEELYIREGAVNYLVNKFHDELLPRAIEQNTRFCPVSIPHPVTAELVAERLTADGYKVSKTERIHHPSYCGSYDDGYAYSHDAYDEYVFTVSW